MLWIIFLFWRQYYLKRCSTLQTLSEVNSNIPSSTVSDLVTFTTDEVIMVVLQSLYIYIYIYLISLSFTTSWSSVSVLPTRLTSAGNPDDLVMMSLFRAYQEQLVSNTRTRARGRRQTYINTHTHARIYIFDIIKK